MPRCRCATSAETATTPASTAHTPRAGTATGTRPGSRTASRPPPHAALDASGHASTSDTATGQAQPTAHRSDHSDTACPAYRQPVPDVEDEIGHAQLVRR